MIQRRSTLAAAALSACVAASILPTHSRTAFAVPVAAPYAHVLLISVDGMHAVDLQKYVKQHPSSTMARLATQGLFYSEASASRPSDSFPGMLALATGGSPFSTGVFYDVSYDRYLSPPGSNCTTHGTVVAYDESIDRNLNDINNGGGIDPKKLPLDPVSCKPVYPSSYLRVNTIFEVIKAGGGYTAWCDKHPSYEILDGPSGQGVDDLYTPEIAAYGSRATSSVYACELYDNMKVEAVINEINAKDHTGTISRPVPAIFGMNFQTVSVGEKVNGYLDSGANPTAQLESALDYIDNSLGKMVTALTNNSLLSDTLIIVTAKHGQAPIDPLKHRIVSDSTIPNIVASVNPNALAAATQDDVSLIWLTSPGYREKVVDALEQNENSASIEKLLAGDALTLMYRNPDYDARTPDIIALPYLGVIYASPSSSKVAEHGGFSMDDTNVPILVSNPTYSGQKITQPVATMQVAPTILRALGYDPSSLQSVQIEKTQPLPGLPF